MASYKISFSSWDIVGEKKILPVLGPEGLLLRSITELKGLTLPWECMTWLLSLLNIHWTYGLVLQYSGSRWTATLWNKPIQPNSDATLMPGAIISQPLKTTSVFDLSCCEWFVEDFNQGPPGMGCCRMVDFFPFSLVNLYWLMLFKNYLSLTEEANSLQIIEV